MWRLTPDQIEQELQLEEENIARSRGRQMMLLRAADAMQLPTADGCRSLREWAAGRLDISVDTASRLAATSRRIEAAPEIAKQLLAGDITFDRAEALSRIPEADHDDGLQGVDIRGLHQIAARHRRVDWETGHDSHRSQYLAIQPNLDESSWRMWAVLDGYAGAVVDKVLTETADRMPRLPDGIRPGLGYRRAVALTSICEETRSGAANVPLITVFLDRDGAEIGGGDPHRRPDSRSDCLFGQSRGDQDHQGPSFGHGSSLPDHLEPASPFRPASRRWMHRRRVHQQIPPRAASRHPLVPGRANRSR